METHETVREMTQGQLKDIAATMIGGIPDLLFDEAQAVVGAKGRLVEKVQKIFSEWKTGEESETAPEEPAVHQTFTILVNYEESVKDLVKRGNYDWANSDLTEKHFPTERTGKQEVEITLVHFGRDISTEDVLAELDRLGYRPAETKELLSLGAKHPDLQREFPMIALGSVWRHPRGPRCCVCLVRNDAEREANLDWIGLDWGGLCRFAAVRK